jgi:predicted site-specific integrase-resolvase
MKAREILELLNISRQALAHYVKTSLIRVTEIAPKRYEYCEEDVMLFKDYLDSMERANECETFTVMLLTNDASKVNTLSKICEDAKVVINNVTIADESFDRLQLLENLMYRRIYTLVVDDLSLISGTESQLICTLLSRKGCHILTVEDGELVNVVKR